MASFSPNTLFDPDERLDCARYFLDKAAHGGQAELQELAAFLLLLEVVAWLQVQTVAGGRLLGGEGEQETEKETDKRAAGGLATGQDVEGVRTALGGTNEGGVSGSAGADATSAEWKTRTKYLTAVVRPARLFRRSQGLTCSSAVPGPASVRGIPCTSATASATVELWSTPARRLLLRTAGAGVAPLAR